MKRLLAAALMLWLLLPCMADVKDIDVFVYMYNVYCGLYDAPKLDENSAVYEESVDAYVFTDDNGCLVAVNHDMSGGFCRGVAEDIGSFLRCSAALYTTLHPTTDYIGFYGKLLYGVFYPNEDGMPAENAVIKVSTSGKYYFFIMRLV